MTSPLSRTIVCIGGALIDRKYLLRPPVAAASSNPASVAVGFGGVARNVAENLARLGAPVRLAAVVGRDPSGDALLAALAALGADTAMTQRMEDAPTAEYAAMLDAATGDMLIAAVAMDDAERRMEQRIADVLTGLPADALVFADANLSAPTLLAVAAHCRDAGEILRQARRSRMNTERSCSRRCPHAPSTSPARATA
jgi:pseudouridine kinase